MNSISKHIRDYAKKFSPSSKNSIFAIGQASILASRASSENFVNLWDAEVKIYSQWGEDGILDFIFKRLGIFKPRIIEIGAGDFSECNSRFAAENLNASVVAIDGRADLTKNISESELKWKTHLVGINTWVTPTNINALIAEAFEFMGGTDLLSSDLDGNDYWILEAADLSQIKIIVVEYNPLFGNTFPLTVPEDPKFDRVTKHHSRLYYGASLKAFVASLNKKGFDFIGTNRVGNNAFFVASKYAELIPFKPDHTDTCYYDWRIREARTLNGELSLLSGNERQKLIADLPLIELSNNQVTCLRQVLHL